MKSRVGLFVAFAVFASVLAVAPGVLNVDSANAAVGDLRVEPEHASLRPSCTGNTPTIRGTSGDDVIVGTPGDDIIVGWAGNDTIDGKGGNDIIIGGAGDDILRGGNGNDLICGSKGNDTIVGQAGDDRISGEADNDTITGGNGADILFGGNGIDVIKGSAGNDTISGGVGDDELNGQADDDVVFGNGGADVILGSNGDDELWGSWGGDEIRGGVGDDFISGGPGWDRLFGWEGADDIQGGDGNDWLWGGPGDDVLNGQDGVNNRVNGGDGTDTCTGETPRDCEIGDGAPTTTTTTTVPVTTTTTAPTTTTIVPTTTTTVPVTPEDLPVPELYVSSDGASIVEVGWPILAGTGVAGVEVFRNGTSIGTSDTNFVAEDLDLGPFGLTYTAQSVATDGTRSEVSEPIMLVTSPAGECVAVALSDDTTAITWVDAPDGDVTLLDQTNGQYLPLEWLPKSDDGTAYYVDSITEQAGQPDPDYRVTIANPDGTFSSQACDGREFSAEEYARLSAMEFPVTEDGAIGGASPAPAATPPVDLFRSAPAPAAAPSGTPTPVMDLCSAGSIGFTARSGDKVGVTVEFEVPAGLQVRGSLLKEGDAIKGFGSQQGVYSVTRLNENGDWVGHSSGLNPTVLAVGATPSFTDDFRLLTSSGGTYRVTVRPDWWWYMRAATWKMFNIEFTDSDGNFVTDPCGLEKFTECQSLGGGVYVSAGAEVEREGQTLGPGCYAVETCANGPATGPFSEVLNFVPKLACNNEPLLDIGLAAAVTAFVVAGMIIVAPVSATVVLGGAGVGLLMSAWTCDQSDNGWLKPSFDLDSSCVATEVSLGAVFAPLQATGALGRAVAIGCVEGGTSTAVYGYVDADTDLNAENVALGTALGCATGGIVQSLFGRLPARGADSLLSRGASEAVGGPKGPRRPYNTEGIRGQFFEYSCTAASCAMIGGGPEAYWREAASTVADGVTPGGTRLVDAADALSEAGFPSIYRADLTLDDLARATELRPAIVSGDGHSLVVDRVLAGEVYIRDPLPVGVGEAYRISVADFLDWWSGRSVVAAP